MKKIITNIVIIICSLTLLYSLFSIITWFIENKKSDSTKSYVIEKAKIKEEKLKEKYPYITTDFNSLVSENNNVRGWIKVPNTSINYPVLQYSDNSYYLTHNFNHEYTTSGWIFLDYRNNDDEDKNTIIYAHNRLDGSMFGTLKNTLDEKWHKENKYIYFNPLSSSNTYEVFSVYTIDASDFVSLTNFDSSEVYVSYLKKIKDSSSISLDVSVNTDDKIITLYTCSDSDKARTILHAKLVQKIEK